MAIWVIVVSEQVYIRCWTCSNSRLAESITETVQVSWVYGFAFIWPGRVAQSVGHLTRKSGVLCSIPGLATYFCFSFRFFKKGSCQLLAKVCARSRRSKPAQEKCG